MKKKVYNCKECIEKEENKENVGDEHN